MSERTEFDGTKPTMEIEQGEFYSDMDLDADGIASDEGKRDKNQRTDEGK